jgi:predicted  nucleic acid-binding Zn-ribbon protein
MGTAHGERGCECGGRKFLSKKEKIEMLEEYRQSLKNEVEGVEEALKALKDE